MKKEYNFYVYIMASDSGTLYIGLTNNIRRRLHEHKNDLIQGFSLKYKCHKLVYYENFSYVYNALEREKQLKRWNRNKKEMLIKSLNPTWRDLAYDLN
jgi:putative endonuclease